MEKFDLRNDIIRTLQARGRKVNTRSNPARYECEHHSKGNLNGFIGDHAFGCHACGGESKPLEVLARELAIEVVTKRGFSVEDYADKKQFSVTKLQSWGVHTATGKFGDDVVAMPYRDAEGKTLRTKHRVRGGKCVTFWHNDGSGTFLYGLDMLAKYPDKPVILVEGESDCHAAWHHAFLAVGLPGANGWKSEWTPLLLDREVYVWQEPDPAAVAMVRKLATDLPHARLIESGGVKDLAELHAEVGKDGFAAALNARIASAVPIDHTPPVVPFSPIIGLTLDRLLEDKLKPVDAVPTPIPIWNTHCRDDGGGIGLARGWHITLGANTGHGKSLLALNLAASAIKAGERVGFLSLEMSETQLATRLLSIATGVSVRGLEKGSSFSVTEWRAAGRIMSEIYDRTGGVVHVNRKRLSKLDDLLASMTYLFEVHGCRYIVTDYLQLAWTGKGEILQAMQEVSNRIRDRAVELNVVSVALSQFNRQTSANHEDMPTPQGLMGGSPLENDSDQVVLLDHSKHDKNQREGTATTRLLLAKNRHGGQAMIDVMWDYRTLQIRELAAQAAGRPEPARSVHDARAAQSGDNRGEAWEPEEPADLNLPPTGTA